MNYQEYHNEQFDELENELETLLTERRVDELQQVVAAGSERSTEA